VIASDHEDVDARVPQPADGVRLDDPDDACGVVRVVPRQRHRVEETDPPVGRLEGGLDDEGLAEIPMLAIRDLAVRCDEPPAVVGRAEDRGEACAAVETGQQPRVGGRFRWPTR
jgi:hypothetical protein